MNRQFTDMVSTFLFAPTETSRANLINDNINEQRIIITGNTVIDALHFVIDNINRDQVLQNKLYNSIVKSSYTINENDRKIILVTGHRRENFGQGF